jgi:uncharacterized protein HemX
MEFHNPKHMEQPIQQPNNPATPPQPQPPVQPQPAQGTSKGLKIFLWILGGCLALVLIIGIVIAGLVWWGAKKVKNELEKTQPQVEQWGKEMQKQADEMQKQAEQMQKNLPPVPTNDIPVQ